MNSTHYPLDEQSSERSTAWKGEIGGGPIILYDGVCNLCNSTVDFVLRHDRNRLFRFAALQSEAGGRLLEMCGDNQAATDSVVLIRETACSTQSDAVLGIVRLLPAPWSLLGALRLVPRWLRDPIYSWVATNRYRWLGRATVCRVSIEGFENRMVL